MPHLHIQQRLWITHSPGHSDGGSCKRDRLLKLNSHLPQLPLHLPVVHSLTCRTHIWEGHTHTYITVLLSRWAHIVVIFIITVVCFLFAVGGRQTDLVSWRARRWGSGHSGRKRWRLGQWTGRWCWGEDQWLCAFPSWPCRLRSATCCLPIGCEKVERKKTLVFSF